MKLDSHPNPALRDAKVVKHWFDHRERWWEVDGGLQSWHHDWNVVRGAGILAGEPPAPGSPAAGVLTASYTRWHGAAEIACDSARERRTVYPTDDRERTCYVGWPGVLVIVARSSAFVTAFRVVPHTRRTEPGSFDEAALAKARTRAGVIDRRGVRDAVRRASLLSRTQP